MVIAQAGTTAVEAPFGAASCDELKAKYHKQGWVKLHQLLTQDELTSINAIIADAIDRPEFRPKSTGNKYDQGGEEYSHVLQVYPRLSAVYPEIQTLIRRLGPFVGDLNGWSQTRLWEDRLFIKPGREYGSKPTVWHQDVKVPVDRRGWATVWIAMVDIPMSRGPMTFLSGSHRLGSLGYIDQTKQNFDLSELLNEADWDVVQGCATGGPFNAGDATMHTMLTLHRASPNLDDEDRVVLAISFCDAKQQYTGAPSRFTDGLGLKAFETLDDEIFPIVG